MFFRGKGDSCLFDWECASKKCSGFFLTRLFGIFGGGVCKATASCHSDSDCSTGDYCDKTTHMCVPGDVLKPGTPCSSNIACTTQACARTGASVSDPTVCCPPAAGTATGASVELGAYYFCKNTPDGGSCKDSKMCLGGSTCVNNVCTKSHTLKQGQSCPSNTSCISGLCAHYGITAGGYRCCPPGSKIDPWNARRYCTNMPNGAPCEDDHMCATGSCADWKCVGPKTVPPGGYCKKDNDCTSNICGLVRDTSGKVCCPNNGQKTDVGYCTRLPTGKRCWHDDDCASVNCHKGSCK